MALNALEREVFAPTTTGRQGSIQLQFDGEAGKDYRLTSLDGHDIMPIRVLVPGEEHGDQHMGGVHKRPPIPDGALKAECPKFMSHGPCGGVRRGGFCEVYPDMTCPWVTLYRKLQELGQLEWMKQV